LSINEHIQPAHELQQLIASGSVCLTDVLLPENFACRHIAGAKNGSGGSRSEKHDS
jgi:hypothetical protein